MWNFGTVWEHVDCRSHVFSSLFERNFLCVFKHYYLKNGKHFLKFLLDFWNLHKSLCISNKKDELYTWNISELIDSEKCSYLNARKLLFSNTLCGSMCSRVLNTAEMTIAAFCPKFPLMQDIFSWKTSLLVRCKILDLFDKTLTADHMYCRHYLKEISATWSNAIISNTEKIFSNFYCIFAIYTKVCACREQKSTS